VSSPAHTRCVTASAIGALVVPRLRCGIVLRSEEGACQVLAEGKTVSVRYAPQFPAPRRERVLPGHLVAAAEAPGLSGVVVWRWYDAVVLGSDPGSVRLWEPAHGEVDVQRRRPQHHYGPGACTYLSAGLPTLNGELPAEPWTGPRTPGQSIGRSRAPLYRAGHVGPPSAGEQAVPRVCRARISGKTAPAARLLIFISSLVDLRRSSRDRAPGKHGSCLQGRSSPCRPSAWSGHA